MRGPPPAATFPPWLKEGRRETKSSGWAFLFSLGWFFGLAGLHRFYLGRYVTGVIWLLTWGLFGIGQFIDLFLINGMVREENQGRRGDVAAYA